MTTRSESKLDKLRHFRAAVEEALEMADAQTMRKAWRPIAAHLDATDSPGILAWWDTKIAAKEQEERSCGHA